MTPNNYNDRTRRIATLLHTFWQHNPTNPTRSHPHPNAPESIKQHFLYITRDDIHHDHQPSRAAHINYTLQAIIDAATHNENPYDPDTLYLEPDIYLDELHAWAGTDNETYALINDTLYENRHSDYTELLQQAQLAQMRLVLTNTLDTINTLSVTAYNPERKPHGFVREIPTTYQHQDPLATATFYVTHRLAPLHDHLWLPTPHRTPPDAPPIIAHRTNMHEPTYVIDPLLPPD